MVTIRVDKIANKLNTLLNKDQRRKLPVLFVLMIIASALEVLSVSLVLPLMSIAMDANSRTDKWYMRFFYNCLHITSIKGIMIALSLFMAATIILSDC